MKLKTLSILLITLVVTTACMQTNNISAKENKESKSKVTANTAAGNYEQGRKSFAKFTPQSFQNAIKYYNKAIQLDPNYAPAYAGLGEIYSIMGYYRSEVKLEYEQYFIDAYKNILKALQLAPNSIEAQRALAYNYLHLSREKDAIATAQKVLSKDPNDYESIYIMWAANGARPGTADIAKVLKLNPNFVPAHIDLGTSYFFKSRNYARAAEHYRKAVEIADSPELHNYLGTALRTQGYYNQAAAEYRRAIELNPNYAPAHMNLGITQYYQKKMKDAIATQEKAIALNPNYPDAYFFLAQGYDKSNQPTQAIRYYRQFLDLVVGQNMYSGYAKTAKQRIAQLGGGTR